jgi:ABC-type lipoprotein export system ATPase subunit
VDPSLTSSSAKTKPLLADIEETKEEEVKYVSDKQEMIIFMGSPGSGKSTFYHNHLLSYTRVNWEE